MASNDSEKSIIVDDAVSTRSEYRVYKRRFLGLAMLIVMNIVVSWGWLTYAPVAPLAKEWFSLDSETPINWLSTIVLFTYCLASPAVVYLLSHYSIKPTLALASVLLLVGNWIRYGGARARSFPLTMAGQILLGLSQPFVLSAPPHYSDLWFTSRGRISATAIASLANPVGAALGQLINPLFATSAHLIPSMVLYISIITTVCTLGWLLVPSTPPTPPCASATTEKLRFRESLIVLRHSRDFWILFTMFSVYLGLFNAFSTLLNQFLLPRGYSLDDAGLTGAMLILVGLVASAIVSPIIDRTHSFLLALRICVPVIAVAYIAFIFAPHDGIVAGVWTVSAVLGAASFSLLPMSLELGVEMTHPVPPEVASSVLWTGGQLAGAVLIVGMDYMKDAKGDMRAALILQAALAVMVVPGAWVLRRGRVGLGRVAVDEARG